jgi:hypothetical protein
LSCGVGPVFIGLALGKQLLHRLGKKYLQNTVDLVERVESIKKDDERYQYASANI